MPMTTYIGTCVCAFRNTLRQEFHDQILSCFCDFFSDFRQAFFEFNPKFSLENFKHGESWIFLLKPISENRLSKNDFLFKFTGDFGKKRFRPYNERFLPKRAVFGKN